jgi:hypothetical protein
MRLDASGHPVSGKVQRLFLACTPRSYKPWVEAVFGELGQVEDTRRKLAWALGVASLLAAGYAELVNRLLRHYILWAIPLFFVLTLGSVLISEVVYEGHPHLDQVFSVLFMVFGAICAILLALLIIHFVVTAIVRLIASIDRRLTNRRSRDGGHGSAHRPG